MGLLRADRITGLGGANAITGSTYFVAGSGTSHGQYLRVEDLDGDFKFGTNDFTIEFWMNTPTVDTSDIGAESSLATMLDHGYGFSENASGAWWVLHHSDDTLIWGYNGANRVTSSSFIKVNTWHHIAVVRTGGNTKIYADGTQVATVSDSMNYTDALARPLDIGAQTYQTTYRNYEGFISNLRIINGTALYTSAFTPPTTRLTKTSDTVLLTCNSVSDILHEETGKNITPNRNTVNSSYATARRDTPNTPVGFSTTTDVGSQYGSTFDGFGSFATSTYMVPPGGNTRERNRGRGVFGGGFNGVSPNVTNAISYVEVQSGGIFKDFGDLTLARGYFPAGQTSSSTRGIFAGGYGGGGGYNTIDFITIANTGNAIDFGDISVAKFGQGGLSNQTRALFGGNMTAPFDNIIEFVTIATTGNASDFGDLVKQRGLTAGASSSTRGVFTGGRSNTPSSNAQDNIMEYVTIATTGNTQDFGDLSTTTRYGHTGFSSPTRGISAGGFDPSGQAKTIDYFTIATLGNSSDFGDLSAVTGYCGSVTNSTRGAVTINNQPNYYNTLEFITIANLGDAQDFGDADVGSSKGHGDFPACASDSHGGVA